MQNERQKDIFWTTFFYLCKIDQKCFQNMIFFFMFLVNFSRITSLRWWKKKQWVTETYLLALGVEPVVCRVPRFILEEFVWWLLLVLVLEALRGEDGEVWALFVPLDRYDCGVTLLWLFKSSCLSYRILK